MQTELNPTPQLSITPEIRNFLTEAAKWSKFLAIVGFVFMGLGLLMNIISVVAMLFASSSFRNMPGLSEGVFSIVSILFYTFFVILYFIPLKYLYNFAYNTQTALQLNDQTALTSAFQNLKSHYKFLGILLIVSFVLFLLVFLVGIVGLRSFSY